MLGLLAYSARECASHSNLDARRRLSAHSDGTAVSGRMKALAGRGISADIENPKVIAASTKAPHGESTHTIGAHIAERRWSRSGHRMHSNSWIGLSGGDFFDDYSKSKLPPELPPDESPLHVHVDRQRSIEAMRGIGWGILPWAGSGADKQRKIKVFYFKGLPLLLAEGVV
jgi:hypothetical protein